MRDIADIRKDYMLQSLDESDVASDPIEQFERWWDNALNSSIGEINSMTLATANAKGIPSARIVLLKGYDENGFVFFTNYESKKGKDLAENPFASLVFFWKELERQVRIDGIVEKIKAEQSDEYFETRPEGSKIGAWASPQSGVISGRTVLEQNVSDLKERYVGKEIPRPPHWGGYIVEPLRIEFWQGRPNRLHDRIAYIRDVSGSWNIERLAP
jgi:pyridoxamine 5'-phosphate oxidase